MASTTGNPITIVDPPPHRDPDAAALWDTAQGNWLKGSRRLMGWLADEGRLASGLTVETAADLMWALMSIDVLDRLPNERGWSRRRVADHLARLFRAVFLRPDPG